MLRTKVKKKNYKKKIQFCNFVVQINKNRMKRIGIVLICLSLVSSLRAQEPEKLLDDPRITKGVLANGLNYYIVKNPVKRGYADFWLVQNTGYGQEDRDQVGVTRMLGDMAFKGTRNFPNNTISDYLKSFGLVEGEDIKTEVNGDNLLYKFSDVEVGRSSNVTDSCLLILFNWMWLINIDEEDLEQEKSFYKNNLLKEINSSVRLSSQIITDILPNSAYSYTNFPNALDKIDSYTTKVLRHYYYTWFRPDRQAIIIAGDVDPVAIENKIKTLFQALPRSNDQKLVIDAQAREIKGVDAVVVSDREATNAKISVYIRNTALPAEVNRTAVPFVYHYMTDLVTRVLKERFSGSLKTAGIPVISMDIEYGSYFDVRGEDALRISVECGADLYDDILYTLSAEMNYLKRNGLSQREIDRFSAKFLEEIDEKYRWRMNTSSQEYARRCFDHFLGLGSLASIELMSEIMKGVVPTLDMEKLNLFASSFINKERALITLEIPENDLYKKPDKNELISAFSIERIVEKPLVNQVVELQIDEPAVPGSVISEVHEPQYDIYLWTISNGATVAIKRTDSEKGHFSMRAVGKGGYSLMNWNRIENGAFINEMIEIGGIGNLSKEGVDNLCWEKGIYIKPEFSISEDGFSGGGRVGEMETFLQMLHSYFKNIPKDESAFDLFKRKTEAIYQLEGADPMVNFNKKVENRLYNGSRFIFENKAVEIEKLDYNYTVDFAAGRLSNVANYHFIFSGDIDPLTIKPLIEKYIGSLPGSSSGLNNWQIVPLYLLKRDHKEIVTLPMITTKSVSEFLITKAISYSPEDLVLSELSIRILSERLSNELYGSSMSVSSKMAIQKYPEEYLILRFSVTSGVLDFEKCSRIFRDTFRRVSRSGITEEELSKAKQEYINEYRKSLMFSNDFWLDVLYNRFIHGKDLYSRIGGIVESVTVQDIDTNIRGLIENGNLLEMTLLPEIL